MSWAARAREAAAAVRRQAGRTPEVAIILGSGLSALAEHVTADAQIPYGAIPHFPVGHVEGHPGRLVIGTLEGRPVAVMQGRVHYYEGYSLAEVVFPVRVFHALGARLLIVTNAAGGLNRLFRAGELMVITDHINFMGSNPLIGPNEEALGPRFPDMVDAYDPALVQHAETVALGEGIVLRKGVYVAVSGPSYETPAELRMMARWGADAVGMSTAHEVIAARHLGMRVLGLSAITDMATGEAPAHVTHEDVIATARRIEPAFVRLMRRIVATLPGA
ncbi:MAG: purine-nucleoside phosphorylase [Armatimonadota bacterium]|nr:purine-nucleoside phosphorylase [Armatimonadota bacterium]MDR7422660.1 purine-nucleoside phosphorylase [Armatimonadota bacterium]MDR7454711.1 purine-nucleoside phosphorylase [Armatimonadota bacterium]MDR7457497.1 purine-nucleoside phosphorylase [Armatimonadota bacterium]MDR7496795.1 purine-nucleoside phosphorylase [Armatimonadota bacterium]